MLRICLIILISHDNTVLGSLKLLKAPNNSHLIHVTELFLKDCMKQSSMNVFVSNSKFLNLSPKHPHLNTNLNGLIGITQSVSVVSTYVIVDPEIDDLLKVLEVGKHTGSSKFIILVQNDLKVQNISEILWFKYKIPNFLIVIYDGENASVYKLNVEDCGSNVSTKYVTNLKDETWDVAMVEWDMKAQLKDCSLKVEWTVLLPYVNPPNSSLRGVLVDFLGAFEDISQRKVAFMPYNPAYLEEIAESYSFDSLLESFETGYSDMFIGPISLNTAEIFDYSPVVSEVSILFLVPKLLGISWQGKAALEKYVTILSVGIIFSVIVVLFNYMVKLTEDRALFYSLPKNFYTFYGLFLAVPAIHILPNTNAIRFYIVSVLLGFFCISTFIQGSIVSALSGNVYRQSIQNIDELLDSNLPIKTFGSMAYLFQISLHERDFEVYERMETLEGITYPAEAGDLAVSLRNFATCVDSGYLIMRPNILKSFSVFKVFNMKQIIAMPKGIYYSQTYHEWFTKLLESGILSKFERIYENYYAVLYFVDEDKRNFIISLDEIMPILTLIGTIQLISFVIFLGEILHFNINKFIHKHMN